MAEALEIVRRQNRENLLNEKITEIPKAWEYAILIVLKNF